MQTSKAFHATLPWLSDADLSRLRAWASENCAASSMTREQGVVVWRATKERARTREAYLRSVRATLKRLQIDVSRLRGRWLMLADEASVVPTLPPACDAPRPAAAEPESDVKIIAPGGPLSRARAHRLQVVKD